MGYEAEENVLTHPKTTGSAGENCIGATVTAYEPYALRRRGQENIPLDPSDLPPLNGEYDIAHKCIYEGHLGCGRLKQRREAFRAASPPLKGA